jgi:pyruvate dehydrogenase E1 component alpha subunit
MGTDFRRVSAVEDFTIMGASYGIEGRQVNGMDVLAVYEAVSEEVARIRKEKVPGFLEIKTYRYKGHSMSDPAKYRTREELESYRLQDPILILKSKMAEAGFLNEQEYETIDSTIKAQCQMPWHLQKKVRN